MSTIVTRAGKGSPLTHVEVDANFTNLNTDKAGYVTGQGAVHTQGTSRTTTVVAAAPKLCGRIDTFSATLAADTAVSFTFTNAAITANDIIVLNQRSGTLGAYLLNAQPGAGSAVITIRNVTPTAISVAEVVGIGYAVIKAVIA
jgi:hypothetical protein